MEILRWIVLAEVFIAFFVAGGLFFKVRDLKSHSIAMLTALYGLHILLFLYGTSKLLYLYPTFNSWFYYEVAFLFGPLLCIHLQSILNQKTKLQWIDALHLVPIVIFWLGYGDVLLMPGAERMQYINTHFMDRTMFWNYALVVQMIVYVLLQYRLIFRSRKSKTKKYTSYAIFLWITYLLATIAIGFLTQFATGWRDFVWYYLINTVSVFGVGYVLYTNPEFLIQFRKKYFSSNLEFSRMAQIEEKIKVAFERDQLYLQNSLSMTSFAEQLDEKPHHISQTFSEKIKENFNDYLNKHRIAQARKLLLDTSHNHLKIEAIALECGFNNKVTFYKAFTKFTGITPSKFRKEKGKN